MTFTLELRRSLRRWRVRSKLEMKVERVCKLQHGGARRVRPIRAERPARELRRPGPIAARAIRQ